MKRNLKIFYLFSKNSIKTLLHHRIGIVAFTLGKIIRFVIFFFFIYFLISHTKVLSGYSLTQTLIFFLAFNVIDTVVQLLFREVYRFRPLVVSGELDLVLLKPYHPFLRILLGGVDILDFFILIPYIMILAYFVFQIKDLNFLHFILAIGLFINAVILAAAFHIIVLAIGILTTEVDHTIMIYRDFTRMAALPIDIYKEPFRSIITFIIPIGIMMTFPVKALFGRLNFNFFLIGIIISGVFFWFSLFLWNKALKKYQSWGS